MRKHPRLDRTQDDIVRALRKAGCSVQSLAALGGGCPDLLCARAGKLWLLEVKDGTLPPSKRELTRDQRKWLSNWNSEVRVVASVEEALRAVGAMR